MITVYFNDRPYRTSHMKAPRGYGSWAFSFSEGGADAIFAPSSTYQDAKRWARNEAKRRAAIAGVKDYTIYADVLP